MQDSVDATSRRPDVPWGALVLTIVWSAVEATIFTSTLRTTVTEVLSGLTGFDVNPIVLVVPLWIFLMIFIVGSFACIHVMNEAIEAKHVGNIVQMILVQITVAMFQVLFLYKELVDASAPWLAQQGMTLGVAATWFLAVCGWVAVRGMTWFLFARLGTPALLTMLSRPAGTHR